MADNFNEVWSRVVASGGGGGMDALLGSGGLFHDFSSSQNGGSAVSSYGPPESRAPEADLKKILENFIEDESSDSAYYAALAARTASRSARTALDRLSAEERRHARRLQTALFLLAGNSHVPKRPAPTPPRSTLEALRQRYAAESRGAGAYAAAAEQFAGEAGGDLRELFLALADDERRHAREIKRLVEEGLG